MRKIRASKCKIRDISKDKDLVKRFLLINHKQGYAYYKIAYGLFYEDELVQLMSFGIPRFNKNYQFELIRDCSKYGIQVLGGVSKLWNHFVKEWDPESCICYSYPHDENDLYTNKYVDYCGFTNVKRAAPEIKIYFEGEWQGKIKRIDKTILERHGVDRLLKVSIGKESGTNEDILFNLGFERKYEDGYSPQLDSYFKGGSVYKITDTDTGKFYIGTEIGTEPSEDMFIDGIEDKWLEYYKANKNSHTFTKEYLRSGFDDPKKMYSYKTNQVRKFCNKNGRDYIVDESTGCMNIETTNHKKTVQDFERKKQMRGLEICQECGSTMNAHMRTCSQYHE